MRGGFHDASVFWPFFSQTQIQNFDENQLKTAQKTT
jgi:hypothetical protein